MWIIFSLQHDTEAQWLYQGLRSRGVMPLEWITGESLSQALHWSYRIGQRGAGLKLWLADGRRITSDEVTGVINRIQYVPQEHLANTRGQDQTYILQELNAFYLAWLNAFSGKVFNQAHPHGLDGAMRHPSNWNYLASRAGLPVLPYRLTSRDPWHLSWRKGSALPIDLQHAPRTSLFVIDGQVVPARWHDLPAAELCESARRLAQLCDVSLLGLNFVAPTTEEWFFIGADQHPTVSAGGDRLLDTMARALTAAL